VRNAYEELEPAYQITRLRIMRGLTQEQLAELVGTQQPSIARLESGKTTPALPFLRRVAEALGTRLTVKFEPCEDTPRDVHPIDPDRAPLSSLGGKFQFRLKQNKLDGANPKFGGIQI